MATESLIAEFCAGVSYPLDDFQVQAISALASGHSVLVAAPTGTGKTVVGEFGIFLARSRKTRAIYTTPIKALSNQKYRDFRSRWGEDQVGLLTGDVVVNAEAPILVMTTEVLRNMLVQGRSLDDVGAIVFDEVHYMGDPERGTAWEEAILLAPKHLALVCLSATVPNTQEIAEWIRAAHGELTAIFFDRRAVPLEHRYWVPARDPKSGPQIHLVIDPEGRQVAPPHLQRVGGELAARVRGGAGPERGGRDTQGQEAGHEPREVPEGWRVIRYLEGEKLTPAIFFVFSRRATEEAALSCLALRPVEHAADLVREARLWLGELSPQDRALRQVSLLFRLLPRGVAVHHAGMLPQLKMLVEELFQAGKLRAVFATDTLAVGINMPARTVVVAEQQKFDGVQRRLLTPNEYRQMTGRAGRRGIDERGVSLVLYSPWVSFQKATEVMSGDLLPLESAFRPTYSTAMNLWLRPEDEERLADLYARSLRRFQHDRDLKDLTERKQVLEDDLERLKASGNLSKHTVWERARELTQADHALRQAHRHASLEAARTVHGLAEVLARFDYLHEGRPTPKAPYLRALFDTNALTLSELLLNGQLEALDPAELAEALSWFSTDRDSLMRGLPLTRRLHRLREVLDHLHGSVLREEEHQGLQISRPLPPDFHGIALAWAEGEELSAIAQRARVQEGDLVGALQKTLDLIGQLSGAASRGPLGLDLLPKLEEADRMLRRGVVESSYEWAQGGLPEHEPEPEVGGEEDHWEEALTLVDDAPDRPSRSARGPRPRDHRPPSSGPGARRGAAARKAKREKLQPKLDSSPTSARARKRR